MSSQPTLVPTTSAEVRKPIRSQLSSIKTSYITSCEGYIMKCGHVDDYFPNSESSREDALRIPLVQNREQLLRQPPSGRVPLPYSKSFLKRHNASTEI